MATIITTPELRARQRAAKRWHLFNVYAQRHGYERELAVYRRRYHADPENVWEGHAMPLAVWGHGVVSNMWVYAASRTFLPDTKAEDVVFFTRRFDVDMALQYIPPDKLPSRLQIAKGEFKSQYLEFTITSVRELTWYVCGIPDEIERILFYTHSIGKKRRRGYGVVQKWEIEKVISDQSVWSLAGDLYRPVPMELLEHFHISGQFSTAFCTYRPPYHDPRFATICAISGKRSVL
jgi:hypothetical protein